MKFSVLLSNIKEAVNTLSGVAGGTANKDDITQNILLSLTANNLKMTATNYNIEMQYDLAVEEVISEGVITVNAIKFKEALSNLDQNSKLSIYLNEDTNVLEISNGLTSYKIRTRTGIDYPSFEEESTEQVIVLEQRQLKTIIDSSSFCVSNEDFRDYLKGIRIEFSGNKLEAFASDGHRMAILETTLEGQTSVTPNFGAILTKRCAEKLSSICTGGETQVELKFTKNAVFTTCNGYRLASKLITCGYPNVRTVIPKQIECVFDIPKDEFSKQVKAVSVFASKRVNGVTFTFGDGKVDMRAENSEHEVGNSSLIIPS
ncbi:MAG: DNA polymerase III subunit beta, partial [Succinivibrio sp.]